MKHTTLQFTKLPLLAAFLGTVDPSAYIVNTQKLTVHAQLTVFDLALAIETFQATLLGQEINA